MKISELAVGTNFEGFYLITDASVKNDKNGKPYLECKLCDNSGVIPAKMWDYNAEAVGINATDSGSIVKVRGNVSDYRGKPQATIARIRRTTAEDDVNIAEIVPSAPIDVEETLACLMNTLKENITDDDYYKVAMAMWNRHMDVWTVAPAGRAMHHAFLHGLLMHTYNMVRMAVSAADIYQGVVNRSLLVAATFLHDFGKVVEYTYSDLGLATGFTISGALVGHLVLGAMEVRDICNAYGIPEEKSLLLQHLLLSHHGQPDWGAAVVPSCVEAEILSYIDVMDARVESYREAMNTAEAGALSDKVFALGNKRIYVESDYIKTEQ